MHNFSSLLLTWEARPECLGPGVEVAHALGRSKVAGRGRAEFVEDGPLVRGEAAAGFAQAGQRADGAHARCVHRVIASSVDLRRFALSTPSRVTWQSLQHR